MEIIWEKFYIYKKKVCILEYKLYFQNDVWFESRINTYGGKVGQWKVVEKREVELGLREAKGMWLHLAATNAQLYVGYQAKEETFTNMLL